MMTRSLKQFLAVVFGWYCLYVLWNE